MHMDEGNGDAKVDEHGDDTNSERGSHDERRSHPASTAEYHERIPKPVNNNNGNNTQLLTDAAPPATSGSPPQNHHNQDSIIHPSSTDPQLAANRKPSLDSHVVVSGDDDDDDDGALPATFLGMMTDDCPSASSTSVRKEHGIVNIITGTDTVNIDEAGNSILPPMMIAMTDGVDLDDVDLHRPSAKQEREEHQVMRYGELCSPRSSNDCDEYDGGDEHGSQHSILSPNSDSGLPSLLMSPTVAAKEGSQSVGRKMEPELSVYVGDCNGQATSVDNISRMEEQHERTIDDDMKDSPSPVSSALSSAPLNGECHVQPFAAWNCDDDKNNGKDVQQSEEDDLTLVTQHEYWSHDAVAVTGRDCVGDMPMPVHVNVNLKLNYEMDDDDDDDEQNSEDEDMVLTR